MRRQVLYDQWAASTHVAYGLDAGVSAYLAMASIADRPVDKALLLLYAGDLLFDSGQYKHALPCYLEARSLAPHLRVEEQIERCRNAQAGGE